MVAIFEHNPLNPATRLAVSRCPFDAQATLLGIREATGLLNRALLSPVTRRYIIYFPLRGKFWRAAEAPLAWLPLGGQYFVAARKL